MVVEFQHIEYEFFENKNVIIIIKLFNVCGKI